MHQRALSGSQRTWPVRRTRNFGAFWPVAACLLLAACAGLQAESPDQKIASPIAAEDLTAAPVEGFTPAAATSPAEPPDALPGEDSESPGPEVPTVAVPEAMANSEAGGPVRFVFPTPGPVPVSAWRPPLYEVPWALTPYDHFYFHRPISADEVNWPLADYRYGGKFFEDVVHTGVDIPARPGAIVRAAGPGKVIKAGYGVYSGLNNPDDPYGLAVVIRHDFGYQGEPLYTVYGHLNQIDVGEGQQLATGDMIGLVGQTGFTTGPHLHFEVRIGENRFFATRNPELWIAPPVGWGVLAGRVMDRFGRPVYGLPILIRNIETGQTWQVITYHSEVAKSDSYYQENVVLGDIPAGRYEIRIAFFGIGYDYPIEIRPGLVNYFTFWGRAGYGDPGLPTPEAGFEPQPVE